jgi:hypothetical protein
MSPPSGPRVIQVTMGLQYLRRCFFLTAALILYSCAIAWPPMKETPKVVPTPIDGEFTVINQADHPVGDVIPVYVSVANGTDEGRTVHPSQVFALNEYGQRIAPIPPTEAARQAGNAGALKAALASSAVGGAAEGALGAAVGSLAGLALVGVGAGAAVGGAVGAAQGALWSAPLGQSQAQSQANAQIQGLALGDSEVRKDFTISGYVFFPKGSYKNLEMLVVNNETGSTETVTLPWH